MDGSYSLTHFMSVVFFYNSWKSQKIYFPSKNIFFTVFRVSVFLLAEAIPSAIWKSRHRYLGIGIGIGIDIGIGTTKILYLS